MNRYPWPEMQVGEVREITSDKSLSAVRSAACMWSGKQLKKTGARPKFHVAQAYYAEWEWKEAVAGHFRYRVERTA